MTYVDSVIDRDTLYWILGVAIPILLTILFFVIFRLARRLPEKTIENPAAGLPPAQPIQEDQLFTTAAREPAAERLTRDRVPANEAVPAADIREAAIPSDDVPADLATRPGGGLPESPSVLPHKPEEIQKAAPKPLFAALSNTRNSFFGRIKGLFAGKPALQANELEDLEEILYTSDLGPQTVQRLLDAVESRLKTDGSSGFEAVREALKAEMIDIFEGVADGDGAGQPHLTAMAGGKANSGPDGEGATSAHLKLVADAGEDRPQVHHGSEEYLEGLDRLAIWDHKPAVIMVVGVNGAGKTTTIGKMARRLAQSGRKVLVAAGDTFRAAAGGQLRVWTERAQVEIFSPEGVTDPSAVAYMAAEKAQSGGFDVVIIDTAGRLHTQKNLMEELKKMKRVIQKPIPTAPHEVLLVLDSNSGQNALIQAREFHGALGVTGVVLTKLDGTAKGGVAVGVACELNLPIKMIGVGEGVDDLRRFSAREFVDSIL